MKLLQNLTILFLSFSLVFVSASVLAGERQDIHGQPSGKYISLVGGPWQYDISGTGTVAFTALRAGFPLNRFLIVEPSLAYTAYTTQAGSRVPFLIPEVQLQLQLSERRIRPFIGVGVGAVANLSDERAQNPFLETTLSASLGTRIRVGSAWGARGELRVRNIGGFSASAAEWTFGIFSQL